MNNYMNAYHDLIRSHLDQAEVKTLTTSVKTLPVENMRYIKLEGIAANWEKETVVINKGMAKVFAAMSVEGTIVSFIMSFQDGHLTLYVGTYKEMLHRLKGALNTAFIGLSMEECENVEALDAYGNEIGMITGLPMLPDDNQKRTFIDLLCEGMGSEDFSLCLIAKRLSVQRVKQCHLEVVEALDTVGMELSMSQSAIGQLDGVTLQKSNHSAQKYYELLKQLETQLTRGKLGGLFQVSFTAKAQTKRHLDKLATVLKTALYAPSQLYDPIRFIHTNQEDLFGKRFFHQKDLSHNVSIGYQTEQILSEAYCTIMDADTMSAVVTLPSQEVPGFYINGHASFDRSMRRLIPLDKTLVIGNIVKSQHDTHSIINPYNFNIFELCLHALIIGMTGSGKTTTVKQLVRKVNQHYAVPFLVIESAKREYFNILSELTTQDIMVFTPGLETESSSVPFRLNPFEFNPEDTLSAHIDSLMATFKAAFDMPSPTPYVLEKAVLEVYQDKGWEPLSQQNRFGVTIFPTLTDLYNKIDVVTDRMGYYPEITSNVKAALKARIDSLRFAGRGMLFDTFESIDMDRLMTTPTIIELDALGDDQSKAFFTGLLLSKIYAYQKKQGEVASKKLNHVLVIEEAHRLLRNVDAHDENASVQKKAIDYFCNMLSEIRAYGQSLVIVDQIASKLAPDTYMNTNLKICHRTVASSERELMGSSMNMTKDQIDYLACLEKGYAAVYSEGDYRPKLVKIPELDLSERLNREAVLSKSRRRIHNEGWFKRTIEMTSSQRASIRNLVYKLNDLNVLGILKRKNTLDSEDLKEIFQYADRLQSDVLTFEHQVCLLDELTNEGGLEHLKMPLMKQISLVLEVGYGI